MLEKDKYEKRGQKIKSAQNIRELIKNNLFSKGLKSCEHFFEEYGKDCEVLYYYAKCLSKVGSITKAIEVYNYLYSYQKVEKKDCYKNAARFEIFKLYYMYDYYAEALEVFYEIKDDLSNIYGYDTDLLENIMKVKIGIEVKIDKKSHPLLMKLVNYNEDLAKFHTSNHLYQMSGKERHTVFEDGINLDELFENVKKVLPTSKKLPKFSLSDLYLFYFPRISKEDIDTIMVVVSKGTYDIISIYPEKTNYIEFTNYNLQDLYLSKDSTLVKKNNQIDKFKRRYNMN